MQEVRSKMQKLMLKSVRHCYKPGESPEGKQIQRGNKKYNVKKKEKRNTSPKHRGNRWKGKNRRTLRQRNTRTTYTKD